MSSDVEKFYAAVVAKLRGTRTWGELNPIEQHQMMQAINIVLGICSQ